MAGSKDRIDFQGALFHRDRFLQADYALGEAFEQLLTGDGCREDCLTALLEQQAAYSEYVRNVLDSLQKHGIPGIDDEDEDELSAFVG